MVSKRWSLSVVVDEKKSLSVWWQHRSQKLNCWLWSAVISVTTLQGTVELREPFKSCFQTTFFFTCKSRQLECLRHLLHLSENSGAVKRCVLLHLKVVRGSSWGGLRGLNGRCSTLMKSADEEADWSPSTDQILPSPFSWVLWCIRGGISRLKADP